MGRSTTDVPRVQFGLLSLLSKEWSSVSRIGGADRMHSRSFGVADAMLLVVAVAIALCVNRMDWPRIQSFRNFDPYAKIQVILEVVLPYVAIGTAALLGMRLRQPRPSFRRVAQQPGALACMVSSAALLLIACWIATTMATGRIVESSVFVYFGPNLGGHGTGTMLHYPGGMAFVAYGDRVGFAVAGAWLALLLSGHWRPERTWIDRLGRATGWLWLGVTVVLWGRSFLL
jgi:hypothetical protein